MKKISLILVILLLFNVFFVLAEDKEFQKVEITFAVGDSVITVNGKKMDVVTPYVVNGTTLVPVRVITESFGADVAWDAETKTATITYAELTIILTIGNKIAKVNGNDTELLAAPELTNGSTMLPLRFITESFGADVSYDSKTARVTVLKEITDSKSIKDFATILKHSTKEYVGDSYYRWCFKRSAEFKLQERSLDGCYNYFTSSERDANFSINIKLPSEKYNIDDSLENYRKEAEAYSTIELGKSYSPKGFPFAHVQFKTDTQYVNLRTYFTDKFIYSVNTTVNAKEGIRKFNELCQISDSFDIGTFNNAATEDLSDVDKYGKRVFYSKDLELKLEIPGEFVQANYDKKDNEFLFLKQEKETKTTSFVSINVYSNYEGHSLDYWVKNDFEVRKSKFNEKLSVFTGITETSINNKKAMYFIEDVKYDKVTKYTKHLYIDAGKYFYNIIFCFDKSSLGKINTFEESIQIGTIDEEKIGQLIRNDIGEKLKYETKTSNDSKYKVDVPTTWEIDNSVADSMILFDKTASRSLEIHSTKVERITIGIDVSKIALDALKTFSLREDVNVTDSFVKLDKYGSNELTHFSYTALNDDKESFAITIYLMYDKETKTLYQITSFCSETLSGQETKDIVETMLKSFTLS